jgi:four helix bundle suffix protein
LTEWQRDDARRAALIDARPQTADDVAAWAVAVKNGQIGQGGRSGRKPSDPSTGSTSSTKSTTTLAYPEIAANGALALIAVACSLLDRQIASLEKAFVEEGGFTERLYRVRSKARGRK